MIRLKNWLYIHLLVLISVSGINIPAIQAQPRTLDFQSFDIPFNENSFLDTHAIRKKTTWQGGQENRVLTQALFHKEGNPLVIRLNFIEKLRPKDASEISCVLIQNMDSLFLVPRFGADKTIQITLNNPPGESELHIIKENQVLAKLTIDVYPIRKEKVYIVPLISFETQEAVLNGKINALFKSFNLSFDVQILPEYYHGELEKNPLLNNPSAEYDHYTRQMRQIRDDYFSDFPRSDKRAFYVFIHNGFVNQTQQGFSVRGKTIAFVTQSQIDTLAYQIAIELARGFGNLKSNPELLDQSNLLLGLGGTTLNVDQWRKLHTNYRSYSFYDDDEEINTFNGFVAYYFWEEDENGNIIFNPGAFRSAVQRPYKKNYFSYNLSIEKQLFKPWFDFIDIPITPLHFVFLLIYILLGIYLKRRLENRLTDTLKKWLRIQIIAARMLRYFLVASLTFITFFFINKIIASYEIYEGKIPDFSGLSTDEVRHEILYSKEIGRSEKPEMATEVLIKRGDDWIVKRSKRVLYFDQYKDSSGIYSIARFNRESDSIVVQDLDISILAPSHYFVVNRINENGSYESQQVYNHQGSNVTQFLLNEAEPAKRILVFVNGYRPTSLGSSLEENFRDIRERGVEFPNSKNMIYNFDRYDYWRPWREIDLKFEQRINPSETYYADGHFSVSTSNYRSLIHFTQVSTRYPTRCKDPDHHVCQNQGRTSWFKSSNKATHRLLPNRPNYKGFKTRRENGRIAGLNLLQQLNEIPNSSNNDTLYLVVHSMGYAYALGMIDEMRGKINFGGFYILAPENASAGKINQAEWREIYQYGVNHDKYKKYAPCMLDGVAPQSRAQNLDPEKQIFIPENLFRRFGFFDSHFVGFYDWIFDIPEGDAGAIQQR
jgi:hypothetical protein